MIEKVKIIYTDQCQHDPFQGLQILARRGYIVRGEDRCRTQFVSMPEDLAPEQCFSPEYVAKLKKDGIEVEFLA